MHLHFQPHDASALAKLSSYRQCKCFKDPVQRTLRIVLSPRPLKYLQNSYTLNWDWMDLSVYETYNVSIMKHRAIVSKPYMVPNPLSLKRLATSKVLICMDLSQQCPPFFRNNPIELAETDAWGEYFSSFIPPTENPREPMSVRKMR
jgi:hypothetical protein